MIRRLDLPPCPFLLKQPVELAVFGWIGYLFRRCKWHGFTFPLPGRRACVLYWMLKGETRPFQDVRYHEVAGHGSQIKEMGGLRYVWTWLVDLFLVGYASEYNRIEGDARRWTEMATRWGFDSWV